MKGTGLILLGVGAYVAYSLFKKGQAAVNLIYSVKRVRYIRSDLSKTWLDIDLGIVNRSNESVSFKKFLGSLRFKGNILADVYKEGGATITANTETIVPIRVYISHIQTATSLFEIVRKIINQENAEGLAIQGMLYAGPLAVPIAQNISLNFNKPTSEIFHPMDHVIAGIGCADCNKKSVGGLSILN